MNEQERVEELVISGEKLLETVKNLVHQGNIRRITIRSREGKNLLVVPFTAGIVGALLLPTWAAVGAVAALVTECTIVIERVAAEDDTRP